MNSATSILFSCAFLAVGRSEIRHCIDGALNSVITKVVSKPDFIAINGYYSLVTEISWEAQSNSDISYDGFAVDLQGTASEVDISLYPLFNCHSGPDHVWLTATENDLICAKNASLSCPTSKGECLCSGHDCSALFDRPRCTSLDDLPAASFQYSVLPETRSIQVPIQFDVEYDFNLYAYRRENISAGSYEKISAVGGCDEVALNKIRDVVKGTACMSIFIGLPTEVDEFYEIGLHIESEDESRNETYRFHHGGSSLSICELDPCREYNVSVYRNSDGGSVLVVPSFVYKTSSPFENGSRFPAPPVATTTTTGSTATSSQTTTDEVSTKVASPTSMSVTTPSETSTMKNTTTTKTASTSKTAVTASTISSTTGVFSSGYECDKEQTIRNFTFPSTQPGFVSNSKGSCQNDSLSATISCALNNRYDENSFQIITCQTIESIISKTYSNDTLKELQLITANISSLTVDNVTNVSQYLLEIADEYDEFSVAQVADATEISSHLSEYYRQVEGDEYAARKQDLVRTLGKISRKISLDSAGAANFSKRSNDINVAVSDVENTRTVYKFEATFYRNKSAIVPFVPIDITIPAEAFEKVGLQSVRVVSVGYKSSSLFPSDRESEWVISSSLGNTTDALDEVRLSESKISVTDHEIGPADEKRIDDFRNEVETLQCVFWDFGLSDWSTEGCTLRSRYPAVCQCDHLTNFAVLVSRTEIPADHALTVLTYVGCGVSILGLLLTLVVICVSRRLRTKYQMKILGNVCFCLAVALALFVFGVDKAKAANCSVLAAFMQLFFLASWFWTSVYSYTIYRDIVQVMMSYGRTFKFRLAALFAYGVPIAIVTLNAGIAVGHIDRDMTELQESAYRARNFCWLRHFSLYFGFLLPVGLLLAFNIIVFCVVVPKVTCKREEIRSSKTETGMKRNVALALSLASTMGLSWIFGYLMLVSDNSQYLLGMSWLFTIVNVFQGVFIFYFTTIRSGELARLWAPVLSGRFSSAPTVSTGASVSDTTSGVH